MKLLIVLGALLAFTTCFPEELEEVLQGGRRTQASNIKYNYFRQGATRGTVILSTNVAALGSTRFDPNIPSVYVIHGWTNNNRSSINANIRDSLLRNHDVNIFVVDWSRYSRLDYASAQTRVMAIGRFVGEFIQQTVRLYGVNLNNVRLVGFSLGAHVAGSAGKTLNGQVASIVGLDPAAPRNRLASTDARYVQAIHTNVGGLGCNFAVGHSDFWPNGGKSQAGCIADLTGICSHNKAYAFYAESLGTNRFVSRKCTNYTSYSSGLCRTNAAALMGGLSPDTSASGTYYLTTNRSSPFGRN